MSKPKGRPTLYTPELAAEICQRLAAGESLRGICRDDHMPVSSVVREWAYMDRDGFSARYTQARDQGLDEVAEEVFEIADTPTGDVIRDRLRFDARRWYLSKLAPKRYGDRIHTELTGADGGPVQIDEKDAAARVAKLMTLAQSRKDDLEGLIE